MALGLSEPHFSEVGNGILGVRLRTAKISKTPYYFRNTKRQSRFFCTYADFIKWRIKKHLKYPVKIEYGV